MRLVIALLTGLLLIATVGSAAPAEKKSAAQKAKTTDKATTAADKKTGAAGKAAQAVKGQCQAKMPNGERCTAKADSGGKYCAQHAELMTKEAASPKKTTKR